jgi:hypothetical protein
MQATCTDANQQYADVAECEDACAGWTLGTPNDQAGDTLYCRENHRKYAETDPDMHCPHAAADGGGVCQ